MDSARPVRDEPAGDLVDEEGGDPVCWAHLVCLECGAVTTEGHRPACPSAENLYNQKLCKLCRVHRASS